VVELLDNVQLVRLVEDGRWLHQLVLLLQVDVLDVLYRLGSVDFYGLRPLFFLDLRDLLQFFLVYRDAAIVVSLRGGFWVASVKWLVNTVIVRVFHLF
jgi:hypothetical protein